MWAGITTFPTVLTIDLEIWTRAVARWLAAVGTDTSTGGAGRTLWAKIATFPTVLAIGLKVWAGAVARGLTAVAALTLTR